MKKDEIIRFSISLPKNLLDKLDERLKNSLYPSRSEIIRDLIRAELIKNEWDSEDNIKLMGIFSIVYSHDNSDLMQKLTSLGHNAKIKIICTTHIHLDNHNCLESIILEGLSKDIKQFCDEISSLKGIKFSSLTKSGSID